MTVVAIHQPNYLPWLGFFAKLLQADVFVFLDDAQYTKSSYINRVGVLCSGVSKWLTIPVRVPLGTAINAARPSTPSWIDDHLERVSNYYRAAPALREVLDELTVMYAAMDPTDSIAQINMSFVREIALRLGITADFRVASDLRHSDKRSNERLIALVRSIDPKGIYLSGAGASEYQVPEEFETAGIVLRFSGFEHPVYRQGGGAFVAGLSALDAIFWLGWQRAGAMLRASVRSQ